MGRMERKGRCKWIEEGEEGGERTTLTYQGLGVLEETNEDGGHGG